MTYNLKKERFMFTVYLAESPRL